MDHWPQYAIATIITFNLFFNLVSDQKRAELSDRVIAVLASFSVFLLYAGILAAGGFWSPVFR